MEEKTWSAASLMGLLSRLLRNPLQKVSSDMVVAQEGSFEVGGFGQMSIKLGQKGRLSSERWESSST